MSSAECIMEFTYCHNIIQVCTIRFNHSLKRYQQTSLDLRTVATYYHKMYLKPKKKAKTMSEGEQKMFVILEC